MLSLDILQQIVDKTSFQTKIVLYENGLLSKMVASSNYYQCIVEKIHQYYYTRHRILFNRCLDCLKYHVYEDGVPMKHRQCHKYLRRIIL